jgi:hypothetical protein
MGVVVEKEVHFQRGRRSRKRITPGTPREPETHERVPRIAYLMALAIKIGDSGVSRTPIPRQGGHAFHGKPDTGSTGRRTLIPLDCGHRRAT